MDSSKNEEIKEFYIEEKIENVLLQLVQPITNLLFLFRNNSDYIIYITNKNIVNVMKEEGVISGIRDYKWFSHLIYTYNSLFLHSILPVKVLNLLRKMFSF